MTGMTLGFEDRDAARRHARVRAVAQMQRLIPLIVDGKPQVVRDFVEMAHETVVALVGCGLPLCAKTIERALQDVVIIHAHRGDMTHDEIAQGCDLSLKLFDLRGGGTSQFESPYRFRERDIAERDEWRERARSAPSIRLQPMNIPLGTISRVRATLMGVDITLWDIAIGVFAFLAIVVILFALLAIGAGR